MASAVFGSAFASRQPEEQGPPEQAIADEAHPLQEETEAQTSHLRAIRRLLLWLTLIAGTAALYFGKDFLMPVVLGVLIALTLSPFVRSMTRAGIPAWLSSTGIVVGLAAALGVMGYLLSGPISSLIEEAPRMRYELKYKLQAVTQTVEAAQQAGAQVEEIASQAAGAKSPQVQEVVIKQPGLVSSFASGAMSVMGSVAVALMLALFLLASNNMFYSKLVASFETLSGKKQALGAVYEIERLVSKYLMTISLINVGVGVLIGLGLWAMGMPNPLLWGFIAFLLNYLPYVGALITQVLVGLFALLAFDSVAYAMIAPGVCFVVNMIEGQIVTPALVGRSLEMNTVAVFLTVVFWGWLWGIPGALMAVPALVPIKVVADRVPSMRALGRLLSDE